MSPMAGTPTEVQALRALIEGTTGGDARADTRRLEDLRSDVLALLADIDTRLEGAHVEREAGAVERVLDLAGARRAAAIREELITEGRFTADQLDQMGVFSHDQLDALERDGTLEDTLARFSQAVAA